MEELVELGRCKRCDQDKILDSVDKHLCSDCVKLENNRVAYFRQHNFNWLDVAKEADLDPWERQPAETDLEWSVWLAYRDAYPGRKPTYRMVAEQLGTTVGAVKKVGMRWTFAARLQLWAKHVDALTMQQREKEIVEMNKQHITLAQKLNDKINRAIDNLNPENMQPKDITQMLKLSSELERKARLDQPDLMKVQLDDSNPDLKKNNTKTEDLGQVIEILSKAGVLTGTFGAKQTTTTTTTTEIVVKEDDD